MATARVAGAARRGEELIALSRQCPRGLLRWRAVAQEIDSAATRCCPLPRLLTVILETAVPDHLAMLWDRALIRALRELRWRPGPPSSRSWCTWATVWTSLLVMPIFFTFTAAASLRRAELLWWLL